MKHLLFVFVGGVVVFLGGFLYTNTPANPSSDGIREVHILSGMKGSAIANLLYKENLIRSPFAFRVFSIAMRVNFRLQAGTYDLSPSMSTVEIIHMIEQGTIATETFTIREGWGLEQIADMLVAKNLIPTQEDWYNLVGKPRANGGVDFSQTFSVLNHKPPEANLEGFLFPDTYTIPRYSSPEYILARILTRMQGKYEANILSELGDRNLFEVLTIASLLEREVKTTDDKRIVAGIIQNRLQAGILLQIDATIAYITGKTDFRTAPEDLRIDSAYNTYRYVGLPPGPIANPGMQSIWAALNHKDTPYFFYLSTQEGKTIFSQTFEEHRKMIQEHLK
ncbi:MAG: endolytic transglycosylase MltG [bacterium]|nr:endolytic transglycosylase MltG [bacterium]